MTSAAGVRTEPPTLAELRAAQDRSRRVLLAVLLVGMVAAAIAELVIGPAKISVYDALMALWPSSEPATQASEIVQAIRLPRLLLALCVGATLGVCGAALQGLFRNPLADPTIIGVSGGGVLGAGLVIVAGKTLAPGFLAVAGLFALPLGAFAGSMIAIIAVYGMSRISGLASGSALILAGIAINAICDGALGYLNFIAFDDQLRELVFWRLGSLGRVTWTSLPPAAVLMVISVLLMLRVAPSLNVYLLGEREAVHLGVNVERMKRVIILLVALGVGSAVALTGLIGFIGLAAPHIIRLFAGADHRIVLPGSALLGALLILCADLIARTAVAPAELPIGLLTSALGGPFFLWMLMRYRRELF
ncbi:MULTISPECIES: iron ABC transporter permease [Rhodomicrobium]|uniref:FecCD family ABC transporter permease n=1 Tax=Rhodomicrobium TaxID=1068 RepID=UPI001FDA8B90|nr:MULTISPECIES: iron ABC transporter permease [Rhodomicrobium]